MNKCKEICPHIQNFLAHSWALWSLNNTDLNHTFSLFFPFFYIFSSCRNAAQMASLCSPLCWPAEREWYPGVYLRLRTEHWTPLSGSGEPTRAAWRRHRLSWAPHWADWGRWAKGSWAWPSGWRRWRRWQTSDVTGGQTEPPRRLSWRNSR